MMMMVVVLVVMLLLTPILENYAALGDLGASHEGRAVSATHCLCLLTTGLSSRRNLQIRVHQLLNTFFSQILLKKGRAAGNLSFLHLTSKAHTIKV